MTLWILGLIVLVIGIVYMLVETNYVMVSRYDFTKELSMNVKVVQLSDIHGRTRFLNGSISELVNRIQPDYVFVTGDLATRENELEPVLQELGRIKCRSIMFIPGNYERQTRVGWGKRNYSEEEYRDIGRKLLEHGIIPLGNEGIEEEVRGRRLLVYGFDNSIYGNEQVSIQSDAWRDKDCFIVLAHSPSIITFVERNKLNYNLLLTGHTHGGQIRLFGRTIGAYRHFHAGLKRMGECQYYYINRGLGTVKLPVRLGCPPEIAVFEL